MSVIGLYCYGLHSFYVYQIRFHKGLDGKQGNILVAD